MSERNFTRTAERIPPGNSEVEWLDSSGAIHRGRYHSNLWWAGDMYIYYTPEFWRLATGETERNE